MRYTGVSDDHPDRVKWNAKYTSVATGYEPHPILADVLDSGVPEGRVLELASGASGSALGLAAIGRHVLCVDVSDYALALLEVEAGRRGVSDKIDTLQADLREWVPPMKQFALVLCTRYWDEPVFRAALGAVAAGGIVAWEAFTLEERQYRPDFKEEWCLKVGEPATLLPRGWQVLEQVDLSDGKSVSRRFLARRVVG